MRRPFRSRSWSQAKLRNPFRIRRRPPAARVYEGQSPETAQQLRPTHSSQLHTAPPGQQNRGPGHVRARRDLRKQGLRRKRSQCSWFFSRAPEQGIAHGGDCCAAGFRPRLCRRGVISGNAQTVQMNVRPAALSGHDCARLAAPLSATSKLMHLRRDRRAQWIRPESVRTACSLRTPKDDQHDDADQRNQAEQPPPAASVRVVQPAYAHRERR